MQMVKKISLILLTVWFALLFFMPKQELYYKLEESLAKQDVRINEQHIDEGLFSLSLENADVYVKGIKVAHVKKLTFFTLLFYSEVKVKGVMLEESLKAVAPRQMDSAVARYSILSPLEAKVEARGSFGTIAGEVNLSKRILHLDFIEAKKIETLKNLLKKGEKGWYYETSF